MGPSGSGKTTLLNVLAGRIMYSSDSKLEGNISINGINMETIGNNYKKIAAYEPKKKKN